MVSSRVYVVSVIKVYYDMGKVSCMLMTRGWCPFCCTIRDSLNIMT